MKGTAHIFIVSLLTLWSGTSSALAQAIVLTITNPMPAAADNFGRAVASVGTDLFVIGAHRDDIGTNNAGAAYLFTLDGTLLTTFTNPTPALNDLFGRAVTGVGTNRVLIGAHFDDTGATDAGAAYLFTLTGTLLTTFTNPTPAIGDRFGISVSAVGTDRVLIGADGDNTRATDAGAAYLFDLNGTLLTTFTNPAPATDDRFGIALAGQGADKIIIGAEGDDLPSPFLDSVGAAYVFSTNGALLTTITNPSPADSDRFGISVAAVGTDKVLIGAIGDDTGAVNSGAAYLFSNDGALLTTFVKPIPVVNAGFGASLAKLDSETVLIGASLDSSGIPDAGMAYLFNLTGSLILTLTNPTPEVDDRFGFSVAAVGGNKILIGAFQDNTGLGDAGTAHLFCLTPPRVNITRSNDTATVFWDRPAVGYLLEETSAIISSPVTGWTIVSFPYATNGTRISVTVPATAERRFYRLRKP